MAAGTHEMTIAETGMPGEVLPEHGVGPRSFAWWGMVWLIATEATLFALLLAWRGGTYVRDRVRKARRSRVPCPDCCERIPAAARVCRFCGCRLDGEEPAHWA